MLRNRIIIIILILLSGILVSNYGGAISYTLFSVCLLIPVVSCIYLFYVFIRFRIYQQIGSRTLRKLDETDYSFILANEDILSYSSIRVTFLGNEERSLATIKNVDVSRGYYLLPEDSYRYNTTLICNCMGEYKIGVDRVVLQDYLKLFRLNYSLPTKLEVKVLPRIVALKSLCFYSKEEGKVIHSVQQNNDSIPDVDMRRYAYGDSIRMINWKASAKAHELLTRRFTQEPKNTIYLLPDFSEVDGSDNVRLYTADHIIESVLALADFFVREQTLLTVFYENRGLHSDRLERKNDVDAFYQKLCNISLRGSSQMDMLISSSIKAASDGNIFILVLHSLTEGMRVGIHKIRERGHEVILILIGDNADSIAEGLRELPVICLKISLDDSIEDVLTGKACH